MSVNYVTTLSGVVYKARHQRPHGAVFFDQELGVHAEDRYHFLGHVHLGVTGMVAFRKCREHGQVVTTVSQRPQNGSHHVPVALARDRQNRQDVCSARRRPLERREARIEHNQHGYETGHVFHHVLSVFRENVIPYRSMKKQLLLLLRSNFVLV